MEYTTQVVDLYCQPPSQVTLQPTLGHQHSTTSCLRAWTIKNLPTWSNVNDTFRLILSPTYLQMLGHHRLLFSIPDDNDLVMMQANFNHLYRSLQRYTIKLGTRCTVFGVVISIWFICYCLYWLYLSSSSVLMQAISVTSLHQLVVPLSTHSLMQTPIFIWILLLIRHILQKSSPSLTFYFWTLRLGLDSSTQNLL